MNLTHLISFIRKIVPYNNQLEVLICGSAIVEEKPRDVDFLIYINGDVEHFLKNLSENLLAFNILFKQKNNQVLKMHNFKFEFEELLISLHIISYKFLEKCISQAEDTNIYSNINLFSLDLKMPVIYRKWILDVKHLCGDISLLLNARQYLSEHPIPIQKVKSELSIKIKEYIKYYFEKRNNEDFKSLTMHILLMQIVNLLIIFCYCVNNQYIPTIKYIEKDMLNFIEYKELSTLCVKIAKGINVDKVKTVDKDLLDVINYLNE